MESIPSDEKVFFDVLHKARQACYMAKDAFYTCFEKEIKKNPVEIASIGLLYPIDCKQTREEYVKQCRTTWVKHFDRQFCTKKRVRGIWKTMNVEEAKDAFYTCFEKEIKKNPVEIASVSLLYPIDCKKTREEYVKQCRTTWVKHFDRQFCTKKKGQRHLEDNECRRGPITIPYTCKSYLLNYMQ